MRLNHPSLGRTAQIYGIIAMIYAVLLIADQNSSVSLIADQSSPVFLIADQNSYLQDGQTQHLQRMLQNRPVLVLWRCTAMDNTLLWFTQWPAFLDQKTTNSQGRADKTHVCRTDLKLPELWTEEQQTGGAHTHTHTHTQIKIGSLPAKSLAFT